MLQLNCLALGATFKIINFSFILESFTTIGESVAYVQAICVMRSQGGPKEPCPPPQFLENIVILCFERRFSKQNSAIRLKSSILAHPKFFGPHQIFGLATPLVQAAVSWRMRSIDTSYQAMNICKMYSVNSDWGILRSFIKNELTTPSPSGFSLFELIFKPWKRTLNYFDRSSLKMTDLRFSSLKLAISSRSCVRSVSTVEIFSWAFSRLVSDTQRRCLKSFSISVNRSARIFLADWMSL